MSVTSGRTSTTHADVAAVFAGGVVGALGRAAVGEALPHDPSAWPWWTFLVNLAAGYAGASLGCGLLALRAGERLA